MSLLINSIILVIALAGVVKGADWFLKAVEIIGQRIKLSTFVVGVLLVGFGTSLPELATSVGSIINDVHNVTIANIIGSNMANILLIIGLTTFFFGKIAFKKDLINIDLPYLLGASILFIILISDGSLALSDGFILLFGFVIYLIYNLVQHLPQKRAASIIGSIKDFFPNKDKEPKKEIPKADNHPHKPNLTYVILGGIGALLLLVLASRFTVVSLLEIAEIIDFQVDTITFITVALGTSLPELLVTFKALKKGQGDLVLGNIVGSSIFNILLVGGVAALIYPQVISSDILIWSMIAAFIPALLLVIYGIKREIHAWEGSILLLIYIALITQIVF